MRYGPALLVAAVLSELPFRDKNAVVAGKGVLRTVQGIVEELAHVGLISCSRKAFFVWRARFNLLLT